MITLISDYLCQGVMFAFVVSACLSGCICQEVNLNNIGRTNTKLCGTNAHCRRIN